MAQTKQTQTDLPAILADRKDPPIFETILCPHRSLSLNGFANLMGFVGLVFLIPLFAFLGSVVLWGLLPAVLLTIWGLWYAVRRNTKDGELSETLRLWPDLIAVHRANPRKADQYWYANPYWVTVKLQDTKEIENYLTLKSSEREIELGAFLTPNERIELCHTLDRHMRNLQAQP